MGVFKKFEETKLYLDITTGKKTCNKCLLTKDISDFYFHTKQKFYYPTCKRCLNDERNAKRIKKPIKKKQCEIDVENGYKSCQTCGETKSLDNFRLQKKNYRIYCNECLNRKSREEKRERDKNKPKIPTSLEIDLLKGKKICKTCKIEKELSFFRFDGSHYNGSCKECRQRTRVENIQKRFNELIRTGKNIKCKKCNIEKSPSDFYVKSSLHTCIECCNKISRKNYKEHNEHYREIANINRKKPEYKQRKREKNREDYYTKIDRRIHRNLSSRIRSSLLAAKTRKDNKTIEIIGCSINEFKQYIESQFLQGMSWDKWGHGRGKFNLDHILPCELFDFSDKNQVKICFNYKNYKPIWWEENVISKSDFLDNGRRARWLSKEEKLEYLRGKGFNV